jgi:hypothetical protein
MVSSLSLTFFYLELAESMERIQFDMTAVLFYRVYW